MKKLIILLSLLQSGLSFSSSENPNGTPSFVTIGPSPACNYDTSSINGGSLQGALNSGIYELRLVNNSNYAGPFTATGAFHLRGGYNNCSDALNDIQGTNHSVLDADFIDSTLTLSVNGNYILENIRIINGQSNTGGGGLNLTANDMTVSLDRVIVENNQAVHGAGIYKEIENNTVDLIIKDSIIQNNTTTGLGIGGGINFKGLGQVVIYGNTLISENEAQYGGGIYLKNTNATIVVGEDSMIDSGMRNNRAREHGGAMYTDNSTVEITGGLKTIPGIGTVGLSGRNYIIFGNLGDSDNDLTGLGGAMFIYRYSNITLNAITIIENHAYAHGGAIYTYFGSIINIGFPKNSNCQVSFLNGCNFFINNSALVGGVLSSATGSETYMKSVNFNGNRANEGSVAVLNLQSKLNLFSSVIYNNGDSSNNDFTDNYTFGSFDHSSLNIEHTTAVKNYSLDSFIVVNNGQNLLNSFNNYFYNPSSGPWLEQISGPPQTRVKYECQIVDDTNNSIDITHYLSTTNAFNNDTQNFVDEMNHDFHTLDTSNLIDYVGNNCPPNPNLLNNNRDIDNQFRSQLTDLGADENFNNEIIFAHDFESSNMPN